MELDQRIKMYEDIYDKKGDEEQYKGILLLVMDDERVCSDYFVECSA